MHNYDNEFKSNAVELCLKSGRKIKDIALELGIPKGTLGGWVTEYKTHGKYAFPGKGHLHPQDVEIVKLRKDLAIACEERDILKKALGIFSVVKK